MTGTIAKNEVSASIGNRATRAVPALLSPHEVALYLGVPLATVYRWRSRGEGPRGVRVGRHVRYRFEYVERWLDERPEQLS